MWWCHFDSFKDESKHVEQKRGKDQRALRILPRILLTLSCHGERSASFSKFSWFLYFSRWSPDPWLYYINYRYFSATKNLLPISRKTSLHKRYKSCRRSRIGCFSKTSSMPIFNKIFPRIRAPEHLKHWPEHKIFLILCYDQVWKVILVPQIFSCSQIWLALSAWQFNFYSKFS